MTSLQRARWLAIAWTLCIVVIAWNLCIVAAGASPWRIGTLLLQGTIGNGYGLAQTFSRATPLIFTGTAVALAQRAGLFNIGAEGQLATGILVCAIIGARVPASLPAPIAWLVVLSTTALAGAILGALPGYLRARVGAHEVITTLMLNGIVAVVTTWLYGGPLRVGQQLQTRSVVASARWPQAANWFDSMRGSSLNLGFLFALALPWIVKIVLARTALGLRIRAVGSNPQAAQTLGVSSTRTLTLTMALSGAIAAMGGAHYVLGAKGYAESGLGAGVGFAGVGVAMVAGNSMLGLALAALLFAALSQGGLVVNAIVPADTMSIAQAIVILAVGALAVHLHRLQITHARAEQHA